MGNDKVEYIDVSAEGDRILGAEVCGGQPLFFSRKHGVLLLSAADGASANVSVPRQCRQCIANTTLAK